MAKVKTDRNIVYPEIYLAIDNVFASKRFTEPEEWMKVIRDTGVTYIEASADTECDPLYMGRDYLKRWSDRVRNASKEAGVKICNLYSGHGTYSTIGLAHTDVQVRNRMLNEWVKPMIETAASLEAGLGFFCHAFANHILQEPALYRKYEDDLADNLAEIAKFSHSLRCNAVGVEQMYSPHQVPWTIDGAKALMKKVIERSTFPLYTTIDTGHQSGQHKFLKPEKKSIIKAMEKYKKGGSINHIWLGPDSAYNLFGKCRNTGMGKYSGLAEEILEKMDGYEYLFASNADGSTYKWLEDLACYSPIIHLQQTNGRVSNHWPFTEQMNKTGTIEGWKVLSAIKTSYEKNEMQIVPVAKKIYLTLEIFVSTSSINYYTINDLRESVSYWRQFIPEDGKRLDELFENCPNT